MGTVFHTWFDRYFKERRAFKSFKNWLSGIFIDLALSMTLINLTPPCQWQRLVLCKLWYVWLINVDDTSKSDSAVSTTPLSFDSVLSLILLGLDLAVLITLADQSDTLYVWYQIYMIVNLSDKESIRYPTYQIMNIRDSKPTRWWTSQMANLSDSKSIRHWTYQRPNLLDTERIRYRYHISNLSDTGIIRYWTCEILNR